MSKRVGVLVSIVIGVVVWGLRLRIGIQGLGLSTWYVRRGPRIEGPILNLRTTTSQKCAAVPRRARI